MIGLLLAATVGLLLILVARLQFELVVSRRVIRAFQQSAVILPRPEQKARPRPWWLLFLLPAVLWLIVLVSR